MAKREPPANPDELMRRLDELGMQRTLQSLEQRRQRIANKIVTPADVKYLENERVARPAAFQPRAPRSALTGPRAPQRQRRHALYKIGVIGVWMSLGLLPKVYNFVMAKL
jgi:hypothetical protein